VWSCVLLFLSCRVFRGSFRVVLVVRVRVFVCVTYFSSHIHDTKAGYRRAGWPLHLHDIAVTNIVWCMAYERKAGEVEVGRIVA